MCQMYNQFITMINGAPATNHAIVTAYVDGSSTVNADDATTSTLLFKCAARGLGF